MDEVLFRILAERVGGYLDAVDRLATTQTREVATELRRMAAAWRAVLRPHLPSGRHGRCAACARHRRTAMCAVWRVASAYFARRMPGDEGLRY